VCQGFGGAARLVRLLGRQKTLAITASMAPLTSDVAREWGVVDEVCPDGDAVRAAEKMLERYVYAPVSTPKKPAVAPASAAPASLVTRAKQMLFGSRAPASPAKQEAKVEEVKRKRNPPESVCSMKAIIAQADASDEQALELERRQFGALWGGPANLRSIGSFLTRGKKAEKPAKEA
jgi:enoyl-CoA hydratase/carnithine racemase